MITSKRYCLARRDIVRESSSFCSMLSSAMRRLYLRACEKTMLSLHLREWLEWKCRIGAKSLGFFCTGLLKVCGLLLYGSSCLGRISVEWSVKK